MHLDDPADTNRDVLGWHDRGPREPLPVAVDTWRKGLDHWPTDSREIFAREANARASIAERNAVHYRRHRRILTADDEIELGRS
jgi:hypothetical protein